MCSVLTHVFTWWAWQTHWFPSFGRFSFCHLLVLSPPMKGHCDERFWDSKAEGYPAGSLEPSLHDEITWGQFFEDSFCPVLDVTPSCTLSSQFCIYQVFDCVRPTAKFLRVNSKRSVCIGLTNSLEQGLGKPFEVCVCISVFMWERIRGWEGKESNTVLFCDAWSLTWVDYCIILFGYLYSTLWGAHQSLFVGGDSSLGTGGQNNCFKHIQRQVRHCITREENQMIMMSLC